MNFTKTALCATLILASATSAAAVSANMDSQASVKVSFGDLDLSASADVTTLYKRLKSAAYKVCMVPNQGRELKAARIAKDCRTSSVGRAVAQVGVPALIEMHQQKTGNARVLIQTASIR